MIQAVRRFRRRISARLLFLLHALHKYPHRRTDSLPGMVGAERMDRQRRLAEWQLNQRPALELVLHRKAWQKLTPRFPPPRTA